MRQATIKSSGTICGISLRSGRLCKVKACPAEPYSGIRFRIGMVEIPARLENVDTSAVGTTVLSDHGCSVVMVEHVLSALYALGITNCLLVFEGDNEVPPFDGAAGRWCYFFESLGVKRQRGEIETIEIPNHITVRFGDSLYAADPADSLRVQCSVNYSRTPIGIQHYDYSCSRESYLSEIADARVVMRECVEGKPLNRDNIAGRLKGFDFGTGQSASVIMCDSSKYYTSLRFPDEVVRHKILDFLGDLSLLGRRLRGSFRIVCPGHKGNLAFARLLARIACGSSRDFLKSEQNLSAAGGLRGD
jgi:UDP-3-O-[3-hydroxymyristoyl] N-acetylglucosamine deacetylase